MSKVNCLKQFVCAVEDINELQIEEKTVAEVLSRFFTDVAKQEIYGETICEVLHKATPYIPQICSGGADSQLLIDIASGKVQYVDTNSLTGVKAYLFI